MAASSELKARVRDHWNAESCGESYAATSGGALDLSKQARERYAIEPYILPFAKFEEGVGRNVLEIGIGMGADHALWARSRPRQLCGVDLTSRAVEVTAERLAAEGLSSQLREADAEALPFCEGSFDIVYSWGVLHHSPNTPECIREVFRVLRPGGVARVMIYHTWSLVGLMLWTRYALLAGRPGRSLRDIYFHHLESPGTKAYTVESARCMFVGAGFSAKSLYGSSLATVICLRAMSVPATGAGYSAPRRHCGRGGSCAGSRITSASIC